MPGSGLPRGEGQRVTAREELLDKLRAAAAAWSARVDEAGDERAAAIAEARAVSYDHAAALTTTLLGPGHVDGPRVSCRGCGRVVVLPYTDERHVAVSVAPLEGWTMPPPRCPACGDER